MTRILVPTDLSKASRKALDYALAFAKQCQASVALLYVVRPKCNLPGRVNDLVFEEELKRGGARQLNALVQRLLGDHVSAGIVVRIGNPAVQILRVARSLRVDLIIMATHGRTGLKHLLLGSVAEAVVRHSPCPVLVVREHHHEFVSTEPT